MSENRKLLSNITKIKKMCGWPSSVQDLLEEALADRREILSELCEQVNPDTGKQWTVLEVRNFVNGRAKKQAKQARDEGEISFAPKSLYPDSIFPILDEHLPYACRNMAFLHQSRTMLPWPEKIPVITPQGKTERLNPLDSESEKPPQERSHHTTHAISPYSKKELARPEIKIADKFYYVARQRKLYKVLIANEPLSFKPGDEYSEIPFRSLDDAEAFLKLLKKHPQDASILTSSHYSYKDDARSLIEAMRTHNYRSDFEFVDVTHLGFVLAHYELSGAYAHHLTQLEHIMTILKNRSLPVMGNMSDIAKDWIKDLAAHPAINTGKTITWIHAERRIRTLTAAFSCFLGRLPEKYSREKYGQIHDFLKALSDKSIVEDECAKLLGDGELCQSTPYETLSLEGVDKILTWMADRLKDSYHYLLMALALGMRITEVDLMLEDPDKHYKDFIIKTSDLIRKGKQRKKRAKVKYAELPLVVLIILRHPELFPFKGIDALQLEKRPKMRNIRARIHDDLDIDFYRRRLRPTTATHLALCQDHRRQSLQRAVNIWTLLSRGGWETAKTANDVYIQSHESNEYVGKSPDKIFALEERKDRVYITREEIIPIDRFLNRRKNTQKYVEDEYDLLEGMHHWDAWLLRHFINTNIRLKTERYMDPDTGTISPKYQEKLDLEIRGIKSLVLFYQEAYLSHVGWERCSDAEVSKVIAHLREGNLTEGYGRLYQVHRERFPDLHTEIDAASLARILLVEMKRLLSQNQHPPHSAEAKAIQAEFDKVERLIGGCVPAMDFDKEA